MVNLNEIKTIEDAKNAKYNEELLTDSEKTIFNNPLILDNLYEMHATVKLLDKVKRAEKADLSGGLSIVSKLLNSLNEAKEDNSIAYQVVNSYNEQVDKAIDELGNLSKKVNLQGIMGYNIKAEKFELGKAKMNVEGGDTDNIQGIGGKGNVEVASFRMENAELTVGRGSVAKSEEEIQEEIEDKEEELATEKQLYDSFIKEGKTSEASEKNKEIKELKKEIKELKAELKQAQIQVNK
jgi:hypothetical protein